MLERVPGLNPPVCVTTPGNEYIMPGVISDVPIGSGKSKRLLFVFRCAVRVSLLAAERDPGNHD
jgi:hypothetical protein